MPARTSQQTVPEDVSFLDGIDSLDYDDVRGASASSATPPSLSLSPSPSPSPSQPTRRSSRPRLNPRPFLLPPPSPPRSPRSASPLQMPLTYPDAPHDASSILNAPSWLEAASMLYQNELQRRQDLVDQQDIEHDRIRERMRRQQDAAPPVDPAVRARLEAETQDRLAGSWTGARPLPHDHHVPFSSSSRSRHRERSQRSSKELHQVYLLNCKGCGSFLTDRGMKAVLLLKPHVTLYSTDVMPDNCGPLYTSPRPSIWARSQGPAVERTCECLTQTLGCYGCGAQVGYHIASPCRKCTSSVTEQQRGSNGHRIVLHCSEISVRERRYVPGEPGVMCARPSTPPLEQLSAADPKRGGPLTAAYGWRPELMPLCNTRTLVVTHRGPTVDEQLLASLRRRNQAAAAERSSPGSWNSHVAGGVGSQSVDYEEKAASRDEGFAHLGGATEERKPAADGKHQTARAIKRGGVVYWSDLVPGGERPEPYDPEVLLSMPVAGR